MKKTVLFINAGHGGIDESGKYTTPEDIGKKTLHTNGKLYHGGGWFYEGLFNRDIANEFIIKATQKGYTCIKTYHQNNDTSLVSRTNFANNHEACKKSVWLSFHSNAVAASTAPQTYAEGVCTFVYKKSTQTATHAKQITEAMQNIFDRWGSKRRATLIHDTPLHETRYTKMPAMLFEVGFFDNPKQADLLMNPKFRAELIDAMLNEIVKIYE